MKSKQILTLAFVLITSLLNAQTTKKVLFLGNSYTYYNSMPSLVKQLALSGGDTLLFDKNLIGGYKLSQHATNSTSIGKIQNNEWDHVVLQDNSLWPAYHYSNFYKGASELIQLINEDSPCLNKTIFYSTWGRENSPVYPYEIHQQMTTDAYIKVAEIFDTEISPVGIAWKKIRDDNDAVNLYDPDGSHPSYAGSYLAACVFYAAIFDQSPVGLSFNGPLSQADALYLQEKAFEAYNEYVAAGWMHIGSSPDITTDVFFAELNNTKSELNNLVEFCCLNTSFDFTYNGIPNQPNINTNLEYIISQNEQQIVRDSITISLNVTPNTCTNQTTTYPLNMDLTNVTLGTFDLMILLDSNLIAEYELEKTVLTSTIESNLENDILLFPNPTTNTIHLSLPTIVNEVNTGVYDSSGKQILKMDFSSVKNIQIPTDMLLPGSYILEISIDNNHIFKKVFKL